MCLLKLEDVSSRCLRLVWKPNLLSRTVPNHLYREFFSRRVELVSRVNPLFYSEHMQPRFGMINVALNAA